MKIIANKPLLLILILILTLVTQSCNTREGTESSMVSVIEKDGKYRLFRNGVPYYINGAGGQVRLDLVSRLGGNSMRLWSTNDETQESGMTIMELLNKAEENNLSVTLGLWVKHPRHDKDFYGDSIQVREQLERFRKDIQTYKNHPALLMWAVGNEVHLHSDDVRVWNAVGDIAAMIKEEDPNHPVSTITAGISKETIEQIQLKAPEIDILGVNLYDNDLSYLPEAIRSAGWKKPYFVGEYGPIGPWKVKRTSWGARHEPIPEEKINAYITAFQAFRQDSLQCLGSYAFKWGWKWEKTYSWFNMFTHQLEEVTTLDALQYVWTSEWPENRSPVSGIITLNGKKADEEVVFQPGESCTAKVDTWDRENDALSYYWQVYTESNSKASGGDPEEMEIPVTGVISATDNNMAYITMPKKKGAYRLYVFVSDLNKRYSISNYPIYVDEK